MRDDPSETIRWTIDLEPVGRRVDVPAGTSLLEAAQKAGVDLVASCGGIGICGTCRVRVVQGTVTPITIEEMEVLDEAQRQAGFRLACRTQPLSDVRLDIPPESLAAPQRVQVEGREGRLALDPVVSVVDLALSQPRMADLRSDQVRINDGLNALGFAPLSASLALWKDLSDFLRGSGWQARLALRREGEQSALVGILPSGAAPVGLAMDLGSTKLALYLVDLTSGATLARSGVMNPQIAYGEDVVSRIAFANRSEENRRLLQTRLVETINTTVAEMCRDAGLEPRHIMDVVAVGNTAIHHFFCGLPVEPLGTAPYLPVISAPLSFAASEIGLAAAPGARVFLPANIAGYVGADHVAALLATRSWMDQRTVMVADIGTNTEISLMHRGAIYSCSCASGPAFEGAHIHDGMRAAPGAVDRIAVEEGRIILSTIGGEPPVGICGSGVLNAVAELLSAGWLDERGVFRPGHPRVRANGRQAEFILAAAEETGHGREILLTRKDVHEIQLAKGAIRAGIDLLLAHAGIQASDLDAFVVAGAFGTYLDLPSALRVGMFPGLPLEQFHQVGNAAGVGAKEMLLSANRRKEAAGIAQQVQYIELTTDLNFTQRFVDAMYFTTAGQPAD